jgi:hypothetical protein
MRGAQESILIFPQNCLDNGGHHNGSVEVERFRSSNGEIGGKESLQELLTTYADPGRVEIV